MKSLTLASGLLLPVDAATQTFLVVGKRGSGKSSTATRLAEQLIHAHVQIAVLDPVDVWWGLKAGQDGSPTGGLDVYVFGGDHADLPLEPTAGVLMADLLVDHRVSAVFVLRTFSNRDKARFVADFAEQLFKRNREVLHLFAEEAHELMPQQPYRGEEEMLGRMLRLQKLGRTSGIGLSCITQRPASLNKNATTQAEILVAHRILGPQDRDAVEGWIKHHRQEERKKEVLTTLPELKTGEAWLWAPDFPEDKPLGLRRVKVLPPDTFDSRRTPKPGERRAEPKGLAPVDLEKLRSKMAATIERAKAEDPRELRRRIGELERERKEWQKNAIVTPAPKAQAKDQGELRRFKAAFWRLNGKATEIRRFLDQVSERALVVAERFGTIREDALRLREELGQAQDYHLSEAVIATVCPSTAAAGRTGRAVSVLARAVATAVSQRAEPGEAITPAKQRILDALSFLEGIGVAQVDKTQLALMADARPTSGGYFNNLGSLRSGGWIAYPAPSFVTLTDHGRALANSDGAPATTQELHGLIRGKLSPAKWRLLEVLIAVYPKSLTKDELAVRAGATPTSGGYFNNLGSLRSLGLIEYPAPGHAAARSLLFLDDL